MSSSSSSSTLHLVTGGANFAAPFFLGTLSQVFLQGLIYEQTIDYASRSMRDSITIKSLIGSMLFITTFSTVSSLVRLWTNVVVNWGTMDGFVRVAWTDRIQPMTMGISTILVQAFMIHRCYRATNKNIFIYILFVPMLLLELGVTCYLTYAFSTVTLNPFLPPMAVIAIGLTPQHMPSGTDDVFTVWFILSAVIDLLITAILLNYLIRTRKHALAPLKATIHRLVMVIWQAQLPTFICAVLTAVLYQSRGRIGSSVDTFFGSILPQLYCISLIKTLLSRVEAPSSEVTEYEMGRTGGGTVKSGITRGPTITRDDTTRHVVDLSSPPPTSISETSPSESHHDRKGKDDDLESNGHHHQNPGDGTFRREQMMREKVLALASEVEEDVVATKRYELE